MGALLEEHEKGGDGENSSDSENTDHGSGHTSKEALQILHDELLDEIDRYEYQHKRLPLADKFLQSDFHHKCVKSLFHWTDCLVMTVTALLLFIAFGVIEENNRHIWLLFEGLIILILFVTNIYVTAWNAKLKRKEIVVKTRKNISEIGKCIKHNIWYPSHYLNLNSPLSPCVSVQWTFRDNELVNLPCNFLVKGDLILLRPGQEVLIHCQSWDKDAEGYAIEEYSPGDIYLPKMDRDTSAQFNCPKGRRPYEPKPFVITATPFLTSLRRILEDSLKRPNSAIHNLIYQARTFFVQIRALPIFLAISFIVNLVRYIYLKDHVGEWPETLLVLQVHTVLPLVPLVFPLFYLLVNNYGAARVECIFKRALKSRKPLINVCEDASSISEDDAREDLEWSEVFKSFKLLLFGHSDILHRTTDLVHVLGSVTSMCCVDKKGILSWPIPVAEKVFFLTSKKVKKKDKDVSEDKSSGVEEWEEEEPGFRIGEEDTDEEDFELPKHAYMQEGTVEVLDVTHDPQSRYGLLFDDPKWKNQISSLKPLGLNILLNTCNLETADAYTKFADHVMCASFKKEDTVAVVNRRCLCELAKQIGFSDQVTDLFDLQMSLGMYRHAHPEATNDQLFRSKSFIRHKTPMPNISTVVVKEKASGMLQLMTQGTADMLLDLCTDYWDGNDLVPLTDNDRKKILDFYHRQSMSAYCSAFSYCPLVEKISPKLKDVYIELPENGLEIYEFRSPTPTKRWDLEKMEGHIPRRRCSVDSLLNTKDQLVTDVDSCFRTQCNQIFIGMVTMQYHAKQDIVHLIEQLETSCIRFVHFSKENELRSRVFSEKVGLEAGWNCHISLLSEDNEVASCSDEEKNADVAFDELQIIDDLRRRGSAPAALDKAGLSPPPQKAVTLPKGSRDSLQVVVIDDVDQGESSTDKIHIEVDGGVEECSGSSQELQRILEDKISNTAASSHLTENTDDSIPFDVFNRAKLPKGIENIRPHLKNVDNVPLLVSLFTDCTPEATQEMIKIMQESGEVVCVIGSLGNMRNTPLFLQADISVGIQPLYPPLCTKDSPIVEIWDYPSPMKMSSKLSNVPCSLSFEREDDVNFIKLIAEARHHSFSMKNCFQFLLSCYMTLSFTQLFTSIFVLPPIISGHHILWLVCLILPCLALTLITTEVDPLVMTIALGKNKGHLKTQVILEYFPYYIVRFLPSMAVVLLCYGMTLYSMCFNKYGNCHLFYGNLNHTIAGTWNGLQTDNIGGYSIAQNFAAMQLVLYLCGISSSYVYRQYHLWKKPPTDNILWCIVVPILVVLQCVYFAIDVSIMNPQGAILYYLSDVPIESWCVGLIWAPLLVPVNELAKMREIKLWVRYQKRARLDFGTKLGMNSPF
ncbi:transmembrane protein 94-like isoform X2 [Lineus longissimus]|uniref:transmembrane protein 94-like isoform X2 n=1 Tax=Lineus longissimus TaxID=88925 RepID=UPI002B4F438E